MTKRRGVSLIENMVVMAMLSAVLGLTATVFHKLFLAEQTSMKAAMIELTTSRLADQFRRDVHAATKVNCPPSTDGDAEVLEFPGSTGSGLSIVYKALEGRVIRDVITAGSRTASETYRLPDCLVSFTEPSNTPDAARPSNGPAASPGLVALSIKRPHATLTPQPHAVRPRRALLIEAQLGRDSQLASGPFEAKAGVSKEQPE